jgi:hypothetical protein
MGSVDAQWSYLRPSAHNPKNFAQFEFKRLPVFLVAYQPRSVISLTGLDMSIFLDPMVSLAK